ncbi:TAP-like protein-domain-containing protein [Rhypophila decipiens]|uniref:TAP-like protein-domain-containing protein n=1 Tax=Rhypophila decipiens TaxID=261697 RepID=A0AAN6Y178_9PEZI|nr:TAP-like protein-domain-containing protein [Rhypophila decipiens]
MSSIRLVICHLLLASAAVAHPTATYRSSSPECKIEWEQCPSGNPGHQAWDCGNVTVPLDYTDESSNETHTVQLWRSKAVKSPSMGSILVNFGGPGGSGFPGFQGSPVIHWMTGGYYDLILFAPRGTSEAGNLRFSCFDTQEERDSYPHDGRPFINSFESLERDLIWSWAQRQAYANQCWNSNKDKRVGELIGTTFVARDMMNIVDALGEDGMLRYWGFSYGSILGATVAAMFPDRIHRVILDGVSNVFNYYNRLTIYPKQGSKFDAVYRYILSECLAAGPDNCALARDAEKDLPIGEQAWALAIQIELLKDRLNSLPIVVNASVVDGGYVSNLQNMLLSPEDDKDPRDVTLHLHHLLNNKSLTEVVEFLHPSKDLEPDDPPQYDDNEDEAQLGIRCSDKTGRNGRAETAQDAISEAKIIGGSGEFSTWIAAASTASCAKWPWKSKESFNTSTLQVEGGLRTRNRILLIGNTIDVKTPIENARNLSTYLAGSVVLEHKDVGHCTLMTRLSKCTADVVTRYLLDGVLPEKGTACEPNKPLFHAPSPGLVNHSFLSLWPSSARKKQRSSRTLGAGHHALPLFD